MSWWALLLALLAPGAVFCVENELKALLGQVRLSTAAEFRYDETRSLELAAAPLRAQGYLLSSPDGSLVKLQLAPRRIIMAISGGWMYYYDPEQKQRHSAPLSYGGEAQQQITAFRSILQGRIEELEAIYDFAHHRNNQHWKLALTPKSGRPAEDAPSIEISGDENGRDRQLLIRQADGEWSRYLLEKTGEGEQLEYSIQRLLTEAVGE